MICHCAIPALYGSCHGCSRFHQFEINKYRPTYPETTSGKSIKIELVDYDLLAKKIADLLREDANPKS